MQEITYNVPGNNTLIITDKLVVKSVRNGEVIPVIDGKVTISLYDTVRTVGINWLWLYCLYCVKLEEGYEDQVSNIKFMKLELKSHKVKEDYIPVFVKPVLFIHDSSYRVLSICPHLAINKSGDIVDVNTSKVYKCPKVTYRYPTVTIKPSSSSVSKVMLRHRLVAIAWVPNDDHVAKPIVDHKDGDKTNCHADNLEWVSFTTNSRRTSEQGLRTDNLTVKVMDYETNSVTVFGSMTQACEYMGRSRINRLEEFCSAPKLINERYQIKLGNDMTAWDFKDNKGSYRVTIDGVLKTYVNLKALKAELLPMLPEKAGIDKIIPKLKRVYPDIVIDFPERAKIGRETYQFKCTKTGEVFDALTRKEITDRTGLPKSTVAKYLGLGDAYSINGFSLRVKSDEPWSGTVSDDLSSRMPLSLTNTITGEVLVFDSLRKTAEFLDTDKNRVKRSLDFGTPYKKYVIKKIKP